MKWCSVTIRASLSDEYTASGIYIVDLTRQQEVCVTISANLRERLKASDRTAVAALDASLDRVLWENLVLFGEGDLLETGKDLSMHLRDFEVSPSKQLRVLVFKFADPANTETRAKHAQFEHATISPRPLDRMVISSTPFAAAHISLFHGYLSSATLSLVRRSIVFADGRFLDGMEGGCGFIPSVGTFGLVAGSLVKKNGEGRLLILVPWNIINQHIPAEFCAPHIDRIGFDEPVAQPVGGVVAVQIKLSPNVVSWGSGVLVESDFVITNNHVIGKHSAEKLKVRINSEEKLVKEVHRPIRDLDIAVLVLSEAFSSEFKPTKLALVNPKPNDEVKSVGYGLFSPERFGANPVPLQSSGIVSKSIKGMIMTTASCWNGSSGGALLNRSSELVGIMSSNAKDNNLNEIMPDMSMSIPISYVRQALERMKHKSGSFELNAQLQKLWKLQHRHTDISQPLKSRI